jgi:hypothetical protein
MKDDTIHTQETQTRATTDAYLTLTHRAVANYIVYTLRQHPAVIAIGQPAIPLTADDAWQAIQLPSITDATILVTLRSGHDLTALLQAELTHRLGTWLERPVSVAVHVTALAPVV